MSKGTEVESMEEMMRLVAKDMYLVEEREMDRSKMRKRRIQRLLNGLVGSHQLAKYYSTIEQN